MTLAPVYEACQIRFPRKQRHYSRANHSSPIWQPAPRMIPTSPRPGTTTVMAMSKSSRREQKLANIRANPRVALSVQKGRRRAWPMGSVASENGDRHQGRRPDSGGDASDQSPVRCRRRFRPEQRDLSCCFCGKLQSHVPITRAATLVDNAHHLKATLSRLGLRF